MGLQETLDGIAAKLADAASPRALAAGRDCVRDLRQDGLVEGAVPVGGQMPPFVLPDPAGRCVRMHGFLTRGPLVISFFRGGWCPFCRSELEALRDAHGAIGDRGASLVAISPQTSFHAGVVQRELGLDFPVLSDVGNAYAREVGLVFRLPDALRAVYVDEYAIDLRCFNGDAREELPVPATYVVDRRGTVIARGIDVDYTRRMEPSAILAALG